MDNHTNLMVYPGEPVRPRAKLPKDLPFLPSGLGNLANRKLTRAVEMPLQRIDGGSGVMIVDRLSERVDDLLVLWSEHLEIDMRQLGDREDQQAQQPRLGVHVEQAR